MPSEAFLESAEWLAGGARTIVGRHFRSDVAVDQKPDMTPVTGVDRAAQRPRLSLRRKTTRWLSAQQGLP